MSNIKKGIILAADDSTRFNPASISTPKPLLPIYDKPSIYYSISQFIQMGINNIGIVCKKSDEAIFMHELNRFNVDNLHITIIATGTGNVLNDFLKAKEFCSNASLIYLTFADNIFVGTLNPIIDCFTNEDMYDFICVTTKSDEPEKYSVYIDDGNTFHIVEKPKDFISDKIVTGIYRYCSDVFDKLEYEINNAILSFCNNDCTKSITDLNNTYIDTCASLVSIDISRCNLKWFDVGNPKSALDAATIISNYQSMFNTIVGCVEVEAYKKKFISKNTLKKLAEYTGLTKYTEYINKFLV